MTRLTTTTSLNVGLLIDWVAPGYQGDIIEGVAKAAAARGANLLIFFGGTFSTEDLTDPHGSVYALARSTAVDGVVAVMGALVGGLGSEASCRAVQRLGVPVVSLGVPSKDLPSVGVDNCVGLQQLCEHLVRDHGRKQFAMIAGPEQSVEALERVRVCRETLDRLGIAVPDGQITHQDFVIPGGEAGVAELFDKRGIRPDQVDAILCGNDLIAEGALDSLLQRAIRVPESIAVTGFDGLERTLYTAVPLTTVSQPLVDLGREATRCLLQCIDGSNVAASTILPSRLLIRSSCGCLIGGNGRSTTTRQAPSLSAGAWALLERRDLIRAELARVARGEFSAMGTGWEERWLVALLQDLREPESNEFLGQLDTMLRRLTKTRTTLELCQQVVRTLREQVLKYIGEPAACRRFEDIAHVAGLMTSSALERMEVNRRLVTTTTMCAVVHSMTRCIREVGQPAFWKTLESDMVKSGVHTCLVARFVGDDRQLSRVVYAFSRVERDWDGFNGQVFQSSEILPRHRVRDQRDCPLVVRSLVHGAQAHGLIAMSFTGIDLMTYEAFATIVALQLTQGDPASA